MLVATNIPPPRREHPVRNATVSGLLVFPVTFMDTALIALFVFAYAGPGAWARLSDPGSDVSRVVDVEGLQVIPGIGPRNQMFVVVTTPDNLIYPQGRVETNGLELRCRISLGGKGRDGSASKADDGDYQVELVMADTSSARLLADFVKTKLATSRTGMTNYPGDRVAAVYRLTLHRRASVLGSLTKNRPSAGCVAS